MVDIIRSDEWTCRFLDAIGIDYTRVSRLVVDAVAGNILTIYITYYGGTDVLDVIPPEANEVQIVECKQP